MKSRRGLSEIISVLIVISIVVAGLGIYTGLSGQRILGETLTVKEAMEQKDNRISELIEFVNMFRVVESSKDAVGIYVHNYGLKNITITNVLVNGSESDTENLSSFYVRDLKSNPIWPDNKTIPMGNMTEIILNFTHGGFSLTNGINSAVIVTDSNKIIQFVNDTS